MVSFLYVCPGAHALNPSFKLNCLLLSLIFAFNLFGLQRASATIKHQQQPQIQVVFFYFSCFTGWVFLVQWMTTWLVDWLVDWLARWLGSLAYGKISRQIKKNCKKILMCCRYNNFPLSNNNLNIKHANYYSATAGNNIGISNFAVFSLV